MSHNQRIEMVGQRFGRLLVTADAPPQTHARRRVICRCDCGNEKLVLATHLRSGDVRSCGCLHKEQFVMMNRKRAILGASIAGKRTAEYRAWRKMIERCEDRSRHNYAAYGGRGISVCARWRHGEDGQSGFSCFLADMGKRPSEFHSLDRREVNGNYEPGNCRWATDAEQRANKRASSLLLGPLKAA